MEWIQRKDITQYLIGSEFIDMSNPKIGIIAQYCMERALNSIATDKDAFPDPEAETARQCFLLVRDEIKHSHDVKSNKVTFKASDVLSQKEGICFAKANLLCALLRQCGIPAGIGYQYLRLDGTMNTSLILHALNYVYLEYAGGWFRIDARGNSDGSNETEIIDSQFVIGEEKLAFAVHPEMGECDIPFVYASHDRVVLGKFARFDNLNELWDNLPDKLSGIE